MGHIQPHTTGPKSQANLQEEQDRFYDLLLAAVLILSFSHGWGLRSDATRGIRTVIQIANALKVLVGSRAFIHSLFGLHIHYHSYKQRVRTWVIYAGAGLFLLPVQWVSWRMLKMICLRVEVLPLFGDGASIAAEKVPKGQGFRHIIHRGSCPQRQLENQLHRWKALICWEKIWEGSNESNEIACCAAPDLFPRWLRLTRRGRNNFQYMKRSHRNSSFSWPLVRFPWGGTTARTQLAGHSTSSERRFNREG